MAAVGNLGNDQQSSWPFLGPPQAPDEIGRMAQYRVIKPLGKGGMGLVFLAEDIQLRRKAALKVMQPDFAAGDQARKRFLREAQAAAALKHDNIVTLYEVGEERGTPFLVMELLTGKSLEEWLRPPRRATIAESLYVAKQILRGLAAAHAAGLIHRDIKPSNLWLEQPRGRVKILDFGLARMPEGDFTAVTQAGQLLGTPGFMAPEQIRGEAVDQRCDLFSVGCVVYRMVTGRLPFRGASSFEMCLAATNEAPQPVQSLNPETPVALGAWIGRLLAKAPADRPASAQEALDELREIEKTLKTNTDRLQVELPPTIDLKNTPSLQARTRQSIALGAMLILAAVVALLLFHASPKSASNERRATATDSHNHEQKSVVNEPESVNLLDLVNVSRDQRQGVWTQLPQGGLRGFAAVKGEDFGLVLPWDPPATYRLKVRVVRNTDRPGQLMVGLGLGSARCNILFDVPQRGKLFTGIGIVDDRKVFDRLDGHVGRVLPQQVAMNIVITVESDRIVVAANDRKIYEWQGDWGRVSRTYSPGTEPLLLGGPFPADFTFEQVTLESLGSGIGASMTASETQSVDAGDVTTSRKRAKRKR